MKKNLFGYLFLLMFNIETALIAGNNNNPIENEPEKKTLPAPLPGVLKPLNQDIFYQIMVHSDPSAIFAMARTSKIINSIINDKLNLLILNNNELFVNYIEYIKKHAKYDNNEKNKLATLLIQSLSHPDAIKDQCNKLLDVMSGFKFGDIYIINSCLKTEQQKNLLSEVSPLCCNVAPNITPSQPILGNALLVNASNASYLKDSFWENTRFNILEVVLDGMTKKDLSSIETFLGKGSIKKLSILEFCRSKNLPKMLEILTKQNPLELIAFGGRDPTDISNCDFLSNTSLKQLILFSSTDISLKNVTTYARPGLKLSLNTNLSLENLENITYALNHGVKFKSLNILSRNKNAVKIPDDKWDNFIDALQKNKCLCEFSIDDIESELNETSKQKLANALNNSPKIRSLSLILSSLPLLPNNKLIWQGDRLALTGEESITTLNQVKKIGGTIKNLSMKQIHTYGSFKAFETANIEEIRINLCYSNEQAQPFMESLSQNKHLKSLCLFSPFTNIDDLSHFIANSPNIEDIQLEIAIDNLTEIAVAIQNANRIKSFSFSIDDFDEGAFKTLLQTTSLEKLAVTINNGYSGLIKLLEENNFLRELIINQINDSDANLLARFIASNKTLKTLNINSDVLGNEGIIKIANALKENTTLQTLHLEKCNIDDSGYNAMAEALIINKALSNLFLFTDTSTPDATQKIRDAINDRPYFKQEF